MVKFKVFSRPSPPGYMKFTMRMLFSSIKRMMSAFVNSDEGFRKKATTGLAFNVSSSSFILVVVLSVKMIITLRFKFGKDIQLLSICKLFLDLFAKSKLRNYFLFFRPYIQGP